jgi:hypothetical protein
LDGFTWSWSEQAGMVKHQDYFLSRIILFKHWPCHDPAMTLVWFPFRRAAGSLRGSVQFHLCTRHSWSTKWKGPPKGKRKSG